METFLDQGFQRSYLKKKGHEFLSLTLSGPRGCG